MLRYAHGFRYILQKKKNLHKKAADEIPLISNDKQNRLKSHACYLELFCGFLVVQAVQRNRMVKSIRLQKKSQSENWPFTWKITSRCWPVKCSTLPS
jgi:hypothetical protein